jgi:hypothetical protein
MIQARVLKLQTLRPETNDIRHGMALLSTFSVMCPETMTDGPGIFAME